MISIIEHIEYLATLHDCVVVPEWGAFIAQHIPAAFGDATKSTVTPPRRDLVFNPEITHNDGLLASSIVRREGITFDEALKVIAANVTVFKQFVAEGSELPIGRLGFFSAGDEGTLHFYPFTCSRAGLEFFGLREFDLPFLASDETAAGDECGSETATKALTPDYSQDSDSSEEKQRHQAWWMRMGRYAAAIVLLLGLTLVLSTPISFTGGHQQQYASISVPGIHKNAPPQVSKPSQAAQPKPAPATAAADKKDAAQSPAAAPTQAADSSATLSEHGRYILVVSTLSSEKQVSEFLATHKDLQGKARVNRMGKKYRVYVDRSDNYGELLQKAYNLPKAYGTGWVAKV